MRRTIEFLDKGGGTLTELLAVVRERVEGALHNPLVAHQPPLAVGAARGDPESARAVHRHARRRRR